MDTCNGDLEMIEANYFDMTEKKFWSEPGFLENYPTIFDILRSNNIPYETVGLVKNGADESSKIMNEIVQTERTIDYLSTKAMFDRLVKEANNFLQKN